MSNPIKAQLSVTLNLTPEQAAELVIVLSDAQVIQAYGELSAWETAEQFREALSDALGEAGL